MITPGFTAIYLDNDFVNGESWAFFTN